MLAVPVTVPTPLSIVSEVTVPVTVQASVEVPPAEMVVGAAVKLEIV